MKPSKRDKNYMAILDQPIKELKKPIGRSVDFDKVMSKLLENEE